MSGSTTWASITGFRRSFALEPVDANGVAAEWSTSPAADPSRAILFLHGGGYISGSIESHRPLATAIGRAAGARTLALGYRRAPEHRFPAAVEDVMSGYRFLLEQGLAPGRIAIAGDSAGGGLTMALMVAARDSGLPLPSCGWCISPWVDLENTGATMSTKAAVDPLIEKPYLMELAEQLSRHRVAAHAPGVAAVCGPAGIAAGADPGRVRRDPAR